MTVFNPGAVVRVPFPYTDRPLRRYRPALGVSHGPIGAAAGLLWVLMITSAENRRWPGDVVLDDHASVGLPSPSVIRTAKIMTIDIAEAEWKGDIGPDRLATVRAMIAEHLGWRG